MTPDTPRRASQFSGAAALFRQKEKEHINSSSRNNNALLSPRGTHGYSPPRTNGGHPRHDSSKNSTLNPPSFVSPGRIKSSNYPSGTMSPPPFAKNSMNKYAISSYLDKHSGTPSQKSKSKFDPSVAGFNSSFSNYNTEPDIKIQVKSDIQKKIEARRHSLVRQKVTSSQDNIPEHIRKARAREERRQKIGRAHV